MTAKIDATRRSPVGALIDEWQDGRASLHAIEAAAHPAITDVLGRVWTWKGSGLYTHDSMAWVRIFIERDCIAWPAATLLDNPNYRWCPHCLQAMTA